MSESKIITVHQEEDPFKQFLICDLDEGREFVDPLNLFSKPFYDIYGINEKGLYAIGGKLDLNTLISSYKWGIFPWFPYKEMDEPYWYCPKERFVIFPEKIHVGHSLRNLLNKETYSITINKAFRRVIHSCRMVDDRDGDEMAWLGDTIENLFVDLHEKGYAKSVEVWKGDELAGGFYGFWYRGIFQGESMFSLQPSASQIGLILLCRNPYINGEKIKFIDTQFETPTFKRLGGEYISYNDYRYIMDTYQ